MHLRRALAEKMKESQVKFRNERKLKAKQVLIRGRARIRVRG